MDRLCGKCMNSSFLKIIIPQGSHCENAKSFQMFFVLFLEKISLLFQVQLK